MSAVYRHFDRAAAIRLKGANPPVENPNAKYGQNGNRDRAIKVRDLRLIFEQI